MCIYLESIFAIVSHFFSEYILESIITLLSKKKSIVGIIKSPEKINYQIHSGIDINESNNSMRELENILSDIRRDIGEKESHINDLPCDVMTQAASGIIWLQTTYSLNILQMTRGRILSTGGDTPHIDTHNGVHKMLFDDLMRISEEAMHMGLYATGIQFFVASILSHKENKCEFKISNNHCRPYKFDSVQTRHILRHNYALLNNSGGDFDSAVYFPYRIRDCKL